MNSTNLLDTSNQYCFVYIPDELRIEILGDLRIDILDRMRVTIKISKQDKQSTVSIRHNLDLYNDTQVEKLTGKTAEKYTRGRKSYPVAVQSLPIP